MTTSVALTEAERFRAAVARRLGLHFDDAKLGFLEDVLRRRAEANGKAAETYLERLEGQEAPREELGALAQELTVPETYFFRHMDQFRAFAGVALPERMRVRSAQRTVRILSAGCASGEEPYSLAMLVCDHLVGQPGWEVSIRSVDVNPAVLVKARRARYPAWSLRETPPDLQKHWLRSDGREFVVDERARAIVAFEERNLVEDDPGQWQAGSLDIVFCRNLIMYLTPAHAEALVARFARALAPGGFLFLGHAETLRGLSQAFHLHHTHETFYYQHKSEAERVPRGNEASPAARPSPLYSGAPLAAALAEGDSWVDAIQKAAERIRRIAQTSAGSAAADRREPAGARAPVSQSDLGTAIDLLRKERFEEALALVRAMPAESARDPDALLLRAVLMTHNGDLREAERVCADLLAIDEMNAGAHYLMALCREAAGDRRGALEHDQVAIYLDPGFAMPRLHLGLMARREGDRQAARRELGQALALLQREEASRLLLFGGGFGREALVALCRTELVTSGGRP